MPILPRNNVQNNDVRVINFTAYLFSCDKFSWAQLTLKIYYRRKFPDLQYCTSLLAFQSICVYNVCLCLALFNIVSLALCI